MMLFSRSNYQFSYRVWRENLNAITRLCDAMVEFNDKKCVKDAHTQKRVITFHWAPACTFQYPHFFFIDTTIAPYVKKKSFFLNSNKRRKKKNSRFHFVSLIRHVTLHSRQFFFFLFWTNKKNQKGKKIWNLFSLRWSPEISDTRPNHHQPQLPFPFRKKEREKKKVTFFLFSFQIISFLAFYDASGMS